MHSLSESLAEMVAVARDYCELIDSTTESSDNWLEALFRLMPRLHAAVTALTTWDNTETTQSSVDLDERFELYSHLRRLLGERDSYWLEFDAAPEEIHMSGSLADDLTDIYYDLRHGLELLDGVQPRHAAQSWQSSYRTHWGQHLVDAERHLYALKVRNQLSLN